ncbi:MAG: NIPSNAP family protein [Planctomycetaceae bacterium]|jgi:hypothetical protein|nr:NIPSNAP family protein [Planctomycetaceae bacterium]
MKRRDFLATTCATGMTLATMTSEISAAEGSEKQKLLRWQIYSCGTQEKKEKLLTVFDTALIPALNRQGISPVGIFESNARLNDGDKSYDAKNDLNVFVLTQFDSADQLTQSVPKLLADQQYLKDAAAIFEAPMNDPLYDTSESRLMLGFKHFPAIEKPVHSAERIFQVRLYNSYHIERNAKKIDMFDIGGEIALFLKCEMTPVFYGETLAGPMMPNLTYMLGFENMEAKIENWKKFVTGDEWKNLSGDPQYKNTANKIINLILKPSPGSQI